jgi:hypothetical protein
MVGARGIVVPVPLHLRLRAPHAATLVGAMLLVPSTAFASGGGPGLGALMSAFLSPVSAVAVIACGLAGRLVESPTVRHRVAIGALALTALVTLLQVFLIGSDVASYGAAAFPTKLAWGWAAFSVALSALALFLAVRLLLS